MEDICIVGGGTAGWLSAAYLSFHFPNKKITIIESSTIPTIGVGEGTWPSIMRMLNSIGIKSTDLVLKTRGGIKLGIKFVDFSEKAFWLSTDPDWETWGSDLTWTLANNNKVPQLRDDSVFGCHFVADELAGLLKTHSLARGIKLIDAVVKEVCVTENRCEKVILENGEEISADWFVDATGFKRLIIGQTDSVFNDYSKELLVDRAVVGQKTYTDPETEYQPYTTSFGMTAGWRFKIPVYDRSGNGYVYSSKFISDEDAEAELKSATGQPTARMIKIHPGYYNQILKNNIIAVGFASGFIEPLEATAIHLAGQTLQLATELIKGQLTQESANLVLNEKIRYIKVVVLSHYAFSKRTEPFWVAASKAALDSKDFQAFWQKLKYKYPTKEDKLDNGYPWFQWNELLRGFGEEHYYPKLSHNAKMQVYMASKSLPNHYKYITEIRNKDVREEKVLSS